MGRSANIFINYRREDSAGHAGRLLDRLSSRFPGRIFMDIDNIEPGVDFVEVIAQAVDSCEILIVVIGREWLSCKASDGRRRLDNPADFVRLEVAAALDRNIRVIPVLVDDAPMPQPEDLPEELIKLTRRNAIELSDARWAFDVDRLLQAIDRVLQEKEPPAPAPGPAAPAQWAPSPESPRSQKMPGLRGWLILGRVLTFVGWPAFLFLNLRLSILALTLGVALIFIGRRRVNPPAPGEFNALAYVQAQTSPAGPGPGA